MGTNQQEVTASDVAKYILENKGSLTGFQIQKLLYYCQAWSLVVNKQPLFDEKALAYKHGPVFQSVSLQHMRQVVVHPSDIRGNSSALSSDTKSFIDQVIESYSALSGNELEDLTHSEKPWREAFNGYTGSASAIIENQAIIDYYSNLLTKDDATRSAHHVPEFDHPKHVYFSEKDYDWLVRFLEED